MIAAGGYPEGALLAPAPRSVYVTCMMDDVLAQIDVRSLDVVDKIAVASSPRAFGQFIAADAK